MSQGLSRNSYTPPPRGIEDRLQDGTPPARRSDTELMPSIEAAARKALAARVWHQIHESHGSRERVLVCAERGRLTRDSHGGMNRVLEGDLVGHVTMITDEGFLLEGFGFATWIYWADARAAWPRDQAPEPCPICGGEG